MAEFKDPRPGGSKPAPGGRKQYARGQWGRGSMPADDGRGGGRTGRRASEMAIDATEAFEWLERARLEVEHYAWVHGIIYGETGTGKSVTMTTLPRSLILACDRHSNPLFRPESRPVIESIFPNTQIQFHPVIIRTYEDMWKAYKVLERGCYQNEWPGGRAYWSWAIDGATELVAGRLDSVLEQTQHDVPEMQDYKILSQDIRTLILKFMALPMHGFLTCGIRNAGTGEKPYWIPDLQGKLAEQVPTQCDVVGRLGVTGEDPDGPRRIAVQPGSNYIAKDLTGKLSAVEGQNLQNWFLKMYGPEWRDELKAERARRHGTATMTVSQNAEPRGEGAPPPPAAVAIPPDVRPADTASGPNEGGALQDPGVALPAPDGETEKPAAVTQDGGATSPTAKAPVPAPAVAETPSPAATTAKKPAKRKTTAGGGSPFDRLGPLHKQILERLRMEDGSLAGVHEQEGEVLVYLPTPILKVIGFTKVEGPFPISLIDLTDEQSLQVIAAIDAAAKTGTFEEKATGELPLGQPAAPVTSEPDF